MALEKMSKIASIGSVQVLGASRGSNPLPLDILIADDHAIFRRGLIQILSENFYRVRHVEAASFSDMLLNLRESEVALLIINLNLPGMPIHYGLPEIRKLRPGLSILALSSSEGSNDVIDVLRAGMNGYATTRDSSDDLARAVKQIRNGKLYISPSLSATTDESGMVRQPDPLYKLTPRQSEVLPLRAQGRSNKEIAYTLKMSLSTAKFHVGSLLRAFGSTNRSEAASKATLLLRSVSLDPATARQP